MKVVLIGFACCYKTSVGKLLADKLRCKHIDTDALIEFNASESISRIFAKKGEAAFRQAESQTLKSLAECGDAVISCGGGSPLQDGFELLVKGGKTVWLTATAQNIKSRLGGAVRPLFDGKTTEELDALIKLRSLYYAKYADITLSTDGLTSVQIADKLYCLLCGIQDTV